MDHHSIGPAARLNDGDDDLLDESDFTFTSSIGVGMDMKQIVEKLQIFEKRMAAIESDKTLTQLATSMLKIGLEFGDMKKEMAEKAENGEFKKIVAEFGEAKKEKEKLKEENVEMKGQMSKLKEEINGVKGQIGKMATQMDKMVEENLALKEQIVALGEEVVNLRQTEQNLQFPPPEATNSNAAIMANNSSMRVEAASSIAGIDTENGEQESILFFEKSADNSQPIVELVDQPAAAAWNEWENEGNSSQQQQDSTIDRQQQEEKTDEDDDDADGQTELDEEEEEVEDDFEVEEEEDDDDEDEDISNGVGKGNVRMGNNKRLGKNTQRSLPKIGENYVDVFGKEWFFKKRYTKGASAENIREVAKNIWEEYGLSRGVDTKNRVYFLCRKNGTGSSGKCPYVGIYKKNSGFFYTRTRCQHEHTIKVGTRD